MQTRFHNDPGTYVAHYTRFETALDCILPSNSLRLGPFASTNDPRETKQWVFSVGSSWSSEKVLTSTELHKLAGGNYEYDQLLKRGLNVLCVTRDAPKASKLDFSERSYGKPRMWAQYGGNHRGVCFVLDQDALDKTLKEKFGDGPNLVAGPVQYHANLLDPSSPGWMDHMNAFHVSGDDLVKLGPQAVFKRHRDKHMRALFFQKNKDWESEAKYRWIVYSGGNDPTYIPIDSALRAMLLGVDFPYTRLDEVWRYCKIKDVWLSRILWINGTPSVYWVPPCALEDPAYREGLSVFRLIPSRSDDKMK